jgi:hypothetical protein
MLSRTVAVDRKVKEGEDELENPEGRRGIRNGGEVSDWSVGPKINILAPVVVPDIRGELYDRG